MVKDDQFWKSFLLTFLLPGYMMDSGKVDLTYESANENIMLWCNYSNEPLQPYFHTLLFVARHSVTK